MAANFFRPLQREFGAGLSRRDMLRLAAVGGMVAPMSGWLDTLAVHAADQTKNAAKKHKSCILLFMSGGPSHVDTFDPKPTNKTSGFKPIATSVPGISICDNLPKTAQMMKEIALLRGMSTSEGSHGRARYYMHTGYREGVGGVVHPSMGAIASTFLGKADDDLPNFFTIGGQSFGAGYAGPFHAPVEISNPERGIENLKPIDNLAALDKRANLLIELEKGFVDRVQTNGASAHQATYERTVKLMHSEKAKGIQISAKNRPRLAMRTDEASSAKAAFWPADWLRPALPLSRLDSAAGIPIATMIRRSRR